MKPMRRTSPAILVLALWMLNGCAVLSPTNPYRPVSPQLRFEARDNRPDAQTLSAPGDFGKLSLSEAIAIALENNPEIVATGYDAAAAQARKDGAWGAMLPSLSAEGAYTDYLDDQRLVPARYNGEPGTFSDTIYAGDLVIRMPLFAGGTLINEARAAKLLSQAAEHSLGRTREELVFNVTSVFYGILAQEQLIESLSFSREALESHLKRVNDLIAAQKAAIVDRLRTEVRLADVRQKIVAERNTLAIQKQLLTNLMGVEATSRTFGLQGTLDESTTSSLSLEEAVAAAFANRPDYLAARKELEAQAKRLDVARGAQSPTVSLFGAYGGRWAADPSEQPVGTDDSEDVGRVGIGIEIPLFQGGRIRTRVKEEQAKLAAAQERLHKMELQIRLEVETALLNFASALERVQTLRKSVEQAEESLRIERQKYEVGKGAIVDVLDAQAALLEAETNYYRVLADVQVARAQIELATGETTE